MSAIGAVKATGKQIKAAAYLQAADRQPFTKLDFGNLGLCESNGQANFAASLRPSTAGSGEFFLPASRW